MLELQRYFLAKTKLKMDIKLKKNKNLSYGGVSKNILVHGDNKIALKTLLSNYQERVKCIYIDPPYNNGEIYTHYNDKEDHDKWLENIQVTLELLRPFLTAEGSIWISIDDSEMHYLKVVADKVFGRRNFLATIVWQHRSTRENRSIFSKNHEYILVYAKDPIAFKKSRNLLPAGNTVIDRYKNPDNDSRGVWQSISANVQDGHASKSQFYDIVAPNGTVHNPPKGRCWAYNKDRMDEEIKQNNIWFGKNGNAVPRIKKFLSETSVGLTPETLWLANEVGTTKLAKKHLQNLLPDEAIFDTPKPEQLIQKILQIATNEGDYMLDCYLGSGSSVSTAHKMKRNYIGIEIGDHIIEQVVARLKKVLDGEKGGISKSINWNGGGSFTFYDLQR